MSDAITGLLGAILMIVFLIMIASKINELALWAVCIAGSLLMLWALWEDDVLPLFGKRSD